MRLFLKFFFGFWLIMLLAMAGTYWLSVLVDRQPTAADRHMGLQKTIDEASSFITESGVADLAAYEPLLTVSKNIRLDVLDDRRNRVAGLDHGNPGGTRQITDYFLNIFNRRIYDETTVTDPDGKAYTVAVSTRLGYSKLVEAMFYRPLIPLIMFPLLTLLLSWLYCRYLFAPVKKLRHVASLLAEGHVGARVRQSTSSRWDGFGRLGADFNRMSDRLEQGFQQQQRIVREITQEMQAPYGQLRNAVEAARVDPSEERIIAIEDEVDAIEKVINHGLALSGSCNSRPLEDSRSIEIVELVSDIVRKADFEATQQTKHVRLRLATPVWISGNQSLIHDAIENVVRNAVHYTIAGGTVDVEILSERKQSGEDSFVDICVNDQGPPVAEKILSQLFDPRFDISKSTNTDVEDRRLGLSLAERSIRLHDGTILARNRVDGEGLRIVIRLPMQEEKTIQEDILLTN